MRTITLEQFWAWYPCPNYTPELVKKLIGEHKTLNAEIVMELNIPASDKLWFLLHEEIICEHDLHELACQYAERALMALRETGREPDPRSWEAIKAKRDWLTGKITDGELEEACSACSAACSAARSAARSAAYSAECSAECSAYSEARSAVQTWQLELAYEFAKKQN